MLQYDFSFRRGHVTSHKNWSGAFLLHLHDGHSPVRYYTVSDDTNYKHCWVQVTAGAEQTKLKLKVARASRPYEIPSPTLTSLQLSCKAWPGFLSLHHMGPCLLGQEEEDYARTNWQMYLPTSPRSYYMHIHCLWLVKFLSKTIGKCTISSIKNCHITYYMTRVVANSQLHQHHLGPIVWVEANKFIYVIIFYINFFHFFAHILISFCIF